MRGHQHAFEHAMRVGFQEVPVLEGAGLALVGIDGHQARPGLAHDRPPLARRREAGAAAAAQAGLVDDVDELLAADRDELARVEERAAGAASGAAALEAGEQELLPRLVEIQATVATARQRAAAAEATLSLQRARHRDLEADAARLEGDLRAAVLRERTSLAELEACRREVGQLEAEAERIGGRLHDCTMSAAGTHHDSAEARESLAAALRAVEAVERRRATLASDLDRAVDRLEQAGRSVESWREKIDSARLQRARLLESRATWEGNQSALAARLGAVVAEIETLEASQRERNESLEAAWSELAGWKARLEACRERRTMLEEMAGRQEGLSDAARRLLSADAGGVPGLGGVLADLVIADVEWASLVDLALGTLSQSLVVESLDDVVGWYAHWSSSEAAEPVLSSGGRVGFVSASSLREPPVFDPSAVDAVAQEGIAGVVGRLDRLLSADSVEQFPQASHRDLVRRLLGRVWVVDRVEHARSLATGAPPGMLFITRAGQCFSSDGGFEFGTAAAATGLVARRSELRAAERRHEELVGTVDAAEKTVDRLQEELGDIRQEIRSAQTRRQQAAETIASCRTECARLGREEILADEAVTASEAGLLDAERQAVELASAREQAQAAVARCDDDIGAARDELSRSQAAIEAIDRNRGEVLEEINGLRIAQATWHERLSRSRESVAALSAALESRRNELRTARGLLADAEARLGAIDLELLAAGGSFAEAMVAAERATGALVELAATRQRLGADRQRAAAVVEACRAESATLAGSIHAHELESGEARHRRARIVERIRDEYDIDIASSKPVAAGVEEAVEVPADRSDLDREIEELRRKLASMTSVNLEALSEAEALTERLAKIEGQLADLTGARQAIEQLIARIDEESRRLLGDTIETVRGHFRELFERLFGGGQADIVLDPEMDLLETTVEIVARPPGKEPRNISLLSGGEKTMTCVALLLAIFRSRPSPFCVLDEVDAALDEANVDRFVGVLRDFLSSTQFIVVTHSKKTMATANTLYGVTMEESGVSKRVSVRFESTAAASATATAKAA